ncbi:uncharacterized protein LOC132798224 [Drosophila nasuta]|uniref:Transcription initiation factor TFIID subunit 12 n=1 Tax=Drosophila albomicans TaxID=7291 RepID=A0A9C6W7V3_DROAB|nr:uncharacterized protein LOC127565124 [Drosophila albomicans]XP_060665985.1 uncharacterized protein LOC132798224 [Drosophila nasuta]
MNNWSWIDELPKERNIVPEDDSSSLSSTDQSLSQAEDDEKSSETNNHLVHQKFLNDFVEKVDSIASMDEQAVDLTVKCMNAITNDICRRVVQIAKYRKVEPDILDLKFVLKREYNMEFPRTN